MPTATKSRQVRNQLTTLTCCALLAACVSAPRPQAATHGAQSAVSVLTLPSGRSFPVLQWGPIFGKGGKRLGLMVSYLSTASDKTVLDAEAVELFGFMRVIAEAATDTGVAVQATFGWTPDAPLGTARWTSTFERSPQGEWRHSQPPAALPALPRSAWSSPRRDEADEAAAVASAEEWLKDLDRKDFETCWKNAAPAFQNIIPRQQFSQLMKTARDRTGDNGSRVHVATMMRTNVPLLGSGRYLTVFFGSVFSTEPHAYESVTLTLDGGSQRVVGYEVVAPSLVPGAEDPGSGGSPFASLRH